MHISTICFGKVLPEPDCECRINVVKIRVDDSFCAKSCPEIEVAGLKSSDCSSSKYENSTAMFCYTSFLASTHARPSIAKIR